MKSPLTLEWSPNDEVLSILEQNGITRHFSLGQVYGFRLYWAERGESHHGWNSKFMKHVMREYRYKQTRDAQEQNCHFMFFDWQPDEQALTILANNGISREFALAQKPSFTLYWFERGDWASNWNTRFIQHVQYKAKLLGQKTSKAISIGEQLSDRSWASIAPVKSGEICHE